MEESIKILENKIQKANEIEEKLRQYYKELLSKKEKIITAKSYSQADAVQALQKSTELPLKCCQEIASILEEIYNQELLILELSHKLKLAKIEEERNKLKLGFHSLGSKDLVRNTLLHPWFIQLVNLENETKNSDSSAYSKVYNINYAEESNTSKDITEVLGFCIDCDGICVDVNITAKNPKNSQSQIEKNCIIKFETSFANFEFSKIGQEYLLEGKSITAFLDFVFTYMKDVIDNV